MPTFLFDNHDGCGDVIFDVGPVKLQAVNVCSNVFFLLAGARLSLRSETAEARASGALLFAVGLFSAVYHASSSWGGFLLDIFAMSIWGAHLAAVSQELRAALGLAAIQGTSLWVFAASLCLLAVGGPFFAFEVLDVGPVAAWNVWANAFALLIVAVALPALSAVWFRGLLRRFLGRVVVNILVIGAGLACTQFIHVLCVPGHFTALPLHSGWHLFSSFGGYLLVGTVDCVLVVARNGGIVTEVFKAKTRRD